MNRKKIALIGAGQLGSRHLQALALLEKSCSLVVVDPSAEGLELSQQRFEQVEGHHRHEIGFVQSLDNVVSNHFDLAIVATNSSVRYQVVIDLLTNFEVDYLILEKFLFQRLDAYEMVGQKLLETGTVAYVNCPRRMFLCYQEIKNIIAPDEPFRMEVVGNNWGLGCNGIHFIDLFQWLCGETIVNWSNELDNGAKSSKRDGYIEFTGSIYGRTANKYNLSITSFEKGFPNISVRISTLSNRFVISEALGKVWYEELDSGQVVLEELGFKMKYQSQLTNQVAQQLFDTGTCTLTPYKDSIAAHVPFLELLLNHYNTSRTHKTDVCPIT